jgi:hypothetical protein
MNGILWKRQRIPTKFVRKSKGKKLFRRLRQEDNIPVKFKETGCGAVDWIYLAQEKLRWHVVKIVTNCFIL